MLPGRWIKALNTNTINSVHGGTWEGRLPRCNRENPSSVRFYSKIGCRPIKKSYAVFLVQRILDSGSSYPSLIAIEPARAQNSSSRE